MESGLLTMLQIKRVYEAPSVTDGYRILVDRLWPRGISKERAVVDVWLKDVAPSPELRVWFGHDPEKFTQFRQRYSAELRQNPAAKELDMLLKQHPDATLLYGAKDKAINHAVVLRDFLLR